MLDLDRFKAINDSLGHLAGDAMLKEVARRLASVLRKADTLARLGGDEFVLVLNEISSPQDVETDCRQSAGGIARPGGVVRPRVHTSASIGISLFPATAPMRTLCCNTPMPRCITRRRMAATHTNSSRPR